MYEKHRPTAFDEAVAKTERNNNILAIRELTRQANEQEGTQAAEMAHSSFQRLRRIGATAAVVVAAAAAGYWADTQAEQHSSVKHERQQLEQPHHPAAAEPDAHSAPTSK